MNYQVGFHGTSGKHFSSPVWQGVGVGGGWGKPLDRLPRILWLTRNWVLSKRGYVRSPEHELIDFYLIPLILILYSGRKLVIFIQFIKWGLLLRKECCNSKRYESPGTLSSWFFHCKFIKFMNLTKLICWPWCLTLRTTSTSRALKRPVHRKYYHLYRNVPFTFKNIF